MDPNLCGCVLPEAISVSKQYLDFMSSYTSMHMEQSSQMKHANHIAIQHSSATQHIVKSHPLMTD